MDGLKVICLLLVGVSAILAAAAPPLWNIDYDNSRLEFIARQAGADFKGGFRNFQAEIRFSESELEQSSAEVSIGMASVDTQNGERDATLAGADWFDIEAFPVASFVADNFVRTENGDYRATGELTIRDSKQPVTFNFQIQRLQDGLHLEGEAMLNRLAFGLGTGDWADDSLIGVQVKVKVTIHAN